jgi:hypothetical protein
MFVLLGLFLGGVVGGWGMMILDCKKNSLKNKYLS